MGYIRQILLLLTTVLSIEIRAQCPQAMPSPCICMSTRFEPVTVICDNGRSLTDVLNAINTVTGAIDSLSILRTPIDRIPAFAFQRHEIRRLVLNRNALAYLDTEAFDGPLINSLQELDLRHNRLASIPNLGVSKLLRLKTLIVAKNSISDIPPNAFASYQSKRTLRKLDLSDNQLRNIRPSAFADLTSVEEMNLDKNFLTEIPSSALRPLRDTLQDLSLGVNHISEIPTGTLDFPKLKSLSLVVNKITSADPEVFRGVPNLVYLYLSSNQLTELKPDMLHYIGQLKGLSLSSNPINRIARDSFEHVPNLVRLELSECQLKEIEDGALQRISSVQIIVLNGNQLSQISRETFKGLEHVNSVDLKGNAISDIEDGCFANLPNLRHLDLSSNKLRTLLPGTFSNSFLQISPPQARVLYLYENPWACDNSLDWLIDWLINNGDIAVDAPGYPPTVCLKPAELYNVPLRQSKSGGPLPSPGPGGPNPVKPPEPLGPGGKTKLSGVSLAATILGIILGVLILTVLLLLVMRYFISQRHRKQKEEEEDLRRFGSTVSGYQSGSYPGGPESIHTISSGHHLTGGRHRGTYFLNRPWYWWF